MADPRIASRLPNGRKLMAAGASLMAGGSLNSGPSISDVLNEQWNQKVEDAATRWRWRKDDPSHRSPHPERTRERQKRQQLLKIRAQKYFVDADQTMLEQAARNNVSKRSEDFLNRNYPGNAPVLDSSYGDRMGRYLDTGDQARRARGLFDAISLQPDMADPRRFR